MSGPAAQHGGNDDAIAPGDVPTPPDAATWRSWGIDPAWSRVVDVASHAGGSRRWHVLDTGEPRDAPPGAATVLCVHGNPTWSYVWAPLLRALSGTHRVIAVDQLGMGYSERTLPRRYVDRVRDLDDVIVALDLPGSAPLVIAGHDWGGAIAMGWVAQDPRQVAGLLLCNTGIAVPASRQAPAIIRLAASAPLLDLVCRGTPTFVRGTSWLSGRRLSRTDRAALAAPYRTSPRRAAVADFVADIPFTTDDPSAPAIADVAARLGSITAPVLLAWGAKDPVFDDGFAADLASRLPNVRLHRFADAGHLVTLEADVASVASAWLADLAVGVLDPVAATEPAAEPGTPRLWSSIEARRDSDDTAFVDGATGDRISWAELARRVDVAAGELAARGLRPGDRVAMLTPPGVDLAVAVYAVWRAGGVTVVADRGLGLRGLGRAVRSARPSWVIGPRAARSASLVLRWAPHATRVEVGELVDVGAPRPAPPVPPTDALAAIVFTSGATGPAKGVRYRHHQLEAQREALAATYQVAPTDRLVAAFAPFALYGPALGIPTALADCDVTKPATLTAEALARAVEAVGATLVFASPSALANVVATSGGGDGRDPVGPERFAGVRTVMSAGAPVASEVLRAVAALVPGAGLHTPYGMTEVLPVADIDLPAIEAAESGDDAGGVCVGRPVDGAAVRIVALAAATGELPPALETGATGEIVVAAPWLSDGYDGLWATERAARSTDADGTAWHRSGDVGHVDATGRLWVEGRVVHVVHTAAGPITPVPVERRVERALGDRRVAAVGVGPAGAQQLVVVVEDPTAPNGLAPSATTHRVRAAVDVAVAAVLVVDRLPVDVRHNAKIDRAALGSWASRVLAGKRAGRPG